MSAHTASLSNAELSLAVAERCGCTACERSKRREGELCARHAGRSNIRVDFAESMDACLAAGGPVEWLKKHPDLKYMGLYRDGGAFRWECEVFLGIREVMRHAEMPSRAFCLAFMAATDDGGAA